MRFIKPSELLLNEDGSIYHLNLFPSNVATNLILVGDPGRVKIVASFFDEIEVLKDKREFVTCTGIYNRERVSVLSTGIGTDNIDIVLNELDALVNINFENYSINKVKKKLNLVRIGTCGILQKDIPPGTGIISSYGFGFDNLLMFYEKQNEVPEVYNPILKHLKENEINTPFYIFPATGTLLDKFTRKYPSGITATCPGFYAPQGRELRLKPRYPNLIDSLSDFNYNNLRFTNFEMETSALYGLSELLGHNCITIDLGIANRITQEVLSDYPSYMAKLVKEVLDTLIS